MLRSLLINAGCVAAVVLGALASLAMLGGSIAGAANMNPKQLRGLKAIMWSVLIGGTTAAVGGVWLLTAGHPGWGALLGAAPAIALVIILVCLTVR